LKWTSKQNNFKLTSFVLSASPKLGLAWPTSYWRHAHQRNT